METGWTEGNVSLCRPPPECVLNWILTFTHPKGVVGSFWKHITLDLKTLENRLVGSAVEAIPHQSNYIRICAKRSI